MPIDPASPRDRVDYIARDADLDLLLTTSDLLPATADVPCQVLPLDRVQGQVGTAPTGPPLPDLVGDTPAT